MSSVIGTQGSGSMPRNCGMEGMHDKANKKQVQTDNIHQNHKQVEANNNHQNHPQRVNNIVSNNKIDISI